MRRGLLAAFAVATAMLAAAGLADATKVYRWTDAQGVTHYGDQPPDARAPGKSRTPATPVTRLRLPAEPEAIARLRIETVEGRNLAWADNLIGGPIEVRLRFQRQRNIVSDPALPTRAVIPAGDGRLLAVLTVAEAAVPP